MMCPRAGATFNLLRFAVLASAAGLAHTDNLPLAPEGPTFIEPILNVTIPVGRDAVLSCVVSELASYKVAWLRINTQTILTIANHVITKNHRIMVTHSDHRTWYLHIKDVQVSDAGDYMCQINTDPMKSQIGHLQVVVPPDILDYLTSTDMVVREGSNVTLKCAAEGSPKPNITWRRENGELISLGNGQGVISVEGGKLNVTKVNRSHMGAFLCIASNGVPPSVSKRIMLIVHFPPMIWIQNQLVGAQLGQEIVLECFSEAFPKSLNHWTRENNEVIADSDKYEPELLDQIYKVHMKLTIRSVSQTDYGIYKCNSKNSLGTTDGSIKLYHIATPTTTTTTTARTTTSTTTTTTTSAPTVTRGEKRQKNRHRTTPSSEPRANEMTIASKSNDKESRQRGKSTEDVTSSGKSGSGRKNSNNNYNSNLERLDMQKDKTAQSRSPSASTSSTTELRRPWLNAVATAVCVLIFVTRTLTNT